jgi:hypothetical protein
VKEPCPYFTSVKIKVIIWFLKFVLSGAMVSVLAIGPKVRDFKLVRWRWVLRGVKNPQYAFLRREIKTLAPCRKILRHVKEPFEE